MVKRYIYIGDGSELNPNFFDSNFEQFHVFDVCNANRKKFCYQYGDRLEFNVISFDFEGPSRTYYSYNVASLSGFSQAGEPQKQIYPSLKLLDSFLVSSFDYNKPLLGLTVGSTVDVFVSNSEFNVKCFFDLCKEKGVSINSVLLSEGVDSKELRNTKCFKALPQVGSGAYHYFYDKNFEKVEALDAEVSAMARELQELESERVCLSNDMATLSQENQQLQQYKKLLEQHALEQCNQETNSEEDTIQCLKERVLTLEFADAKRREAEDNLRELQAKYKVLFDKHKETKLMVEDVLKRVDSLAPNQLGASNNV